MIAAFVVAAALLSSCATGTWTGDVADPAVVVLGDSLVFESEQATIFTSETWITDDLVAAGTRAWVTGWTGLRFERAYPDLWDAPFRDGVVPDVLVIAVGTNDMRVDAESGLPPTTPEEVRPILAAWLAEVPDACVRVVGVAESISGWGLDVTGPAFNAMLAEEVALHADAAYVPWAPDPAWTGGGAEPHMTMAGRDAYRAMIVAQVADCLS